jgi:hypothetical protein
LNFSELLEIEVATAKSRKLGTAGATSSFQRTLDALSDKSFISLLEITGYIPDLYLPDSSEETLYSKFVEQVVCEWAKRIGFNQSSMQTQKSSVEDITITDNRHVIVADAKSFRLGRSQAAPNVKDVLKQGDYIKWLKQYPSQTRLGGLVIFPSFFEWKKSSDVHAYLTDSTNPVMLLYYEHLASFLKFGVQIGKLISFYKNHATHFPNVIDKTDNPKSAYFEKVNTHIFGESPKRYQQYMQRTMVKRIELRQRAIAKIDGAIRSETDSVASALNQFHDIEALRKFTLDRLVFERTNNMERMKDNIIRFR